MKIQYDADMSRCNYNNKEFFWVVPYLSKPFILTLDGQIIDVAFLGSENNGFSLYKQE
jgi:hypothetical protein